jgi:hypothetical protein
MDFVGVFVPISLFAMIYGIVYIAIRRKERMALLQKGADISLFEKKRRSPLELKWGMLLVGIGVGILLGRILAATSCLGEEASYFSMICLLGGLSLVIYHFMEKRIAEKETPQN